MATAAVLTVQPAIDLLDRILERAVERTANGRRIDDHQLLARRVAGIATRIESAKALHACVESLPGSYALITRARNIWTAEATLYAAMEVERAPGDFGLEPTFAIDADVRAACQAALSESRYREIGKAILESRGVNDGPIEALASEVDELRDATRRFAETVIAPEAESIHREDRLIPEHFITEMAQLGYFGMAIPEEFGGVGMTNLMMIVATEELSAASLPAAGSLITRPEILAKALLRGGTEDQKKTWLPRIASGESMVAVAVTEPNVGSDVASLTCRAAPAIIDGVEGFRITGAKAWCTFAGRADILGLLARTENDSAAGRKGLSLFIVEKPVSRDKEFECVQSSGGVLRGKADATIGYRGMHSYTLQFDNYFVPAANLVGGASGRGKGFYLQMNGFVAGRLQTGGRSIGLAQACLREAAAYTLERPQFGRAIAEYQSTQYELGRMAVELEAARRLTYAAAHAMDAADSRAPLLAAMAKLLGCRMAVRVSQQAQVLHGGWGYAEEYPISRYVCDALVLPIFEGVEPILEMKVIGRALLAG